MQRFWLTITLGLLLTACAGKQGQKPVAQTPTASAEQMYQQADRAIAKKNYREAVRLLDKLDNEHPFSAYGERGLRDLILSHYALGDYLTAGAVASRYIRLYPRGAHTDYAYYIKGMSNYHQNRGVFAKVFPMDTAWRDPGTQTEAYKDFNTLVKRYPKSRYTPKAQEKIRELGNLAATKELHIAKYYLERKRYVASANRASFVIRAYPQTQAATEAKALYAKASEFMGTQANNTQS